MPRPVCVPCKTEMRPDKNGVPYVQTSDGRATNVWDSDRWRCLKCGTTILTGFGKIPYLVNYKLGFNESLMRVMADDNVVVEEG